MMERMPASYDDWRTRSPEADHILGCDLNDDTERVCVTCKYLEAHCECDEPKFSEECTCQEVREARAQFKADAQEARRDRDADR